MTNSERVIWGIHGGKQGDADSLFLKKKVVAMGWYQMGDLSALKADRESFKEKVAEVYQDIKKGAIPNWAGQLFRFVHEVQVGDIIVYPSKIDKMVHIGIVKDGYSYNPEIDNQYPNLRTVDWKKSVRRTQLTQGALYEVGSAMTFFRVTTYAEEIEKILEGKQKEILLEVDPTVAYVTADIEQNTTDFVLKRLSQEQKGHPFEHFVAHLLGCMGYRTRVVPEGPDGGVDIIAHKDELGFEPPIIKVQVKSTSGSISSKDVNALYGVVDQGEFGLFVTLGTFTTQAKNFARGKSNLRIIDGDELVRLVFRHYDSFESSYKGMLPLKKVYVPEVGD